MLVNSLANVTKRSKAVLVSLLLSPNIAKLVRLSTINQLNEQGMVPIVVDSQSQVLIINYNKCIHLADASIQSDIKVRGDGGEMLNLHPVDEIGRAHV